MEARTKKQIGGGLLLTAALFIGRESIAWLLGKVFDFVSNGTANVTLASFPWQNAAATCLALIGAYLAFWPGAKPAEPSPEAEARLLAHTADRMTVRLNNHRHWSINAMETVDPLIGVIRESLSLLMTFEKHGYSVPKLASIPEPERVAIGLIAYFQSMAALLRDGHLVEARDLSAPFAIHAESSARTFRIEHFR